MPAKFRLLFRLTRDSYVTKLNKIVIIYHKKFRNIS